MAVLCVSQITHQEITNTLQEVFNVVAPPLLLIPPVAVLLARGAFASIGIIMGGLSSFTRGVFASRDISTTKPLVGMILMYMLMGALANTDSTDDLLDGVIVSAFSHCHCDGNCCWHWIDDTAG